MIKKLLSLVISFIIFTSSFVNAAGDIALEDIQIMVSTPDKFYKDTNSVVSMSVLAGMAQYEKMFESVSSLRDNLSGKEALLESKQNTRILKNNDFQNLDRYYKHQKANVYEPAFSEAKKHRLAYLEFYKSDEIKAQWQASEDIFVRIEKEFTTLEKQWMAMRNRLLKSITPAEEAVLKREITILNKEISSSQKVFIEAQYQIFKEEYTTLSLKLRAKAGMFLPKDLDRFVLRMEGDLKRLQIASTDEELAFARRAISESIEKFSTINPGINAGEVKYFKEAMNKFFKDVRRKLTLKSSVPLLAASGLAIFMLSAQSAQAEGISNKNVIVRRTLDYCFKETPQLMLANTLTLRRVYGDEVVCNIIYENQSYAPLITKQINTLKYINENSTSEQSLIADIVVSSSDFKLPVFSNFTN